MSKPICKLCEAPHWPREACPPGAVQRIVERNRGHVPPLSSFAVGSRRFAVTERHAASRVTPSVTPSVTRDALTLRKSVTRDGKSVTREERARAAHRDRQRRYRQRQRER